uniref:Nuclease (SNase domain protein) n=1 Tax=Caulobacter sp. (strain K31) TaxID=366602 RepID=B0T9A3_CAUSK
MNHPTLLSRACGLGLALSAFSAAAALADPCTAVPDKGPVPAALRPESVFRGPVAYIGDGDSLCVATGPSPSQWVEVRLADFYAPELHAPGGREAKRTLDQITAGQRLTCLAQHRSYDRIVAICRIDGRSVGALMRAAGVAEGGRGRR